MKVARVASAGEFIEKTCDLRADDPIRNNVLSTFAEAAQSGKRTYEACYWWIVEDEDGQVVGAAFRGEPGGYILSPMLPLAAAALGLRIAAEDSIFPCVVGSKSSVEKFLEAYLSSGCPGSGRAVQSRAEEIIYAMSELRDHTCKEPYTLRPGQDADNDILLRWMKGFSEDIGIPIHGLDSYCGNMIRSGNLTVLCNSEGEPVSMANHNGIVDGSKKLARIGPVYTDPGQRCKGYASAVTYHVCQQILRQGAQPMLYAQAHNEKSNKVYRNLGFLAIDTALRVTFASE